MVFEYQFYQANDGRLDEEVERMREVAILGAPQVPNGPPVFKESLFDRYGIPRPLGAWTAISGPRQPLFGYIVRWNSLAERDAAFPPFWADPLWHAVRSRTDAGSPLVDRIDTWLMNPSSVWAAVRKDGPDTPVGGVHEMRIHHTRAGYAHYLSAALAEIELPQCQAFGAVVLGVFDVVIGPKMPAIISFIAWPDYEAQQRARARLDVEPRLLQRMADDEVDAGGPIVLSVEHTLLQPVDYGVPAANFGMSA